jgi:hypothetical protein
VISKLIQTFKHDKYTHASISLDKELNNMYSFGRRNTYNPFIGRFKNEDINKGIYKLCRTLPGIITEVEVSKEQYERAKELLEHFISNSDLYKYNYKGLLYSLLNKPLYSQNRFLCSEFVYHIFKECGIADFKISRNLVRPQSLLSIRGRIIYSGNLKEIREQLDTPNSIPFTGMKIHATGLTCQEALS